MKLLVVGSKARTEKYLPDLPIAREVEIVVVERGASDDEILDAAADADFIMADAISPVSARLDIVGDIYDIGRRVRVELRAAKLRGVMIPHAVQYAAEIPAPSEDARKPPCTARAVIPRLNAGAVNYLAYVVKQPAGGTFSAKIAQSPASLSQRFLYQPVHLFV